MSDLRPAGRSWLITASDPTHPSTLDKLPHTASSAVWSHDGDSVLFLAQAAQDTPPGYRDVFRYKLSNDSTQNLTAEFTDRTINGRPISLANGGLLLSYGKAFEVGAALFAGNQAKSTPVKFPVPVIRSLTTNPAENAWVFLGSGSTQPEGLYYTASLEQMPCVLATPALEPPGLKSASTKRLH